MVQRKVYNIEQFIEEQDSNIQELIVTIHDLFMSYPNVSCKIRYNIPFYDYGSWKCYLNPVKKGKAIEVVFLEGLALKSMFPFLEDKGRKMVAGITMDALDENEIEKVLVVWEESLVNGT